MGGAGNMHGRNEKYKHIFVTTPEGKKPLGDRSVYGRIILEWILEN
jgi:hypothetical protein